MHTGPSTFVLMTVMGWSPPRNVRYLFDVSSTLQSVPPKYSIENSASGYHFVSRSTNGRQNCTVSGLSGKGLTLGIGLDGAVERAEEAGVFAAFKLAQRLGLEARALAEGCVGIIGAEGRPVVVRTEVEVFVLVCLKLAVGIDRDRRALELLQAVIARRDHVRLQHVLVLRRGVERGRIRHGDGERAHAAASFAAMSFTASA